MSYDDKDLDYSLRMKHGELTPDEKAKIERAEDFLAEYDRILAEKQRDINVVNGISNRAARRANKPKGKKKYGYK